MIDMRCFIHVRFAEIALFGVDVEEDDVPLLKKYNQSSSPELNYAFVPPFSDVVDNVLDSIKIARQITIMPTPCIGHSIARVAKAAFRHYHGVKVVLV